MLISPYRRTRTGRAVGGCFPKEERSPAQKERKKERGHAGKYFHPLSVIYLGGEPGPQDQVSCTNNTRPLPGAKQHSRGSISTRSKCKKKKKRQEAGEVSPGNSDFYSKNCEARTHHDDVLVILSAQV